MLSTLKQRLSALTGKARGDVAEDQALAFLRRQGLRLEARNVHCRGGELDLVMREGNALVFVEVRARASAQFGGAAGSIDHFKQRRVVRAAQHYLQRLQGALPPCRFDVVAIEGDAPPVWIKGAFEAA